MADIKRALEQCIRAVNLMGVDGRRSRVPTLSSRCLLAHADPDSAITEQVKAASTNFAAIRTWLMMVLGDNVFGGASDQALTEVRKRSRMARTAGLPGGRSTPSRYPEPADTIHQTAIELPRHHIRQADLFPCAFTSLLQDRWGEDEWHKDHVFPQAWFTGALSASGGFRQGKREKLPRCPIGSPISSC